ncbi:MAG: nitroreductase/quinone reductase family protein [Armatimonadota bacterium]|nr:nitroreductase/quinone reductase family protein [Armatimonadota bacterium]MDR7546248.1 nitroreductase/quinone reductase family protein [Armatimonadota bacterium]MDR7559270.1 nitroreductase/quinone reductase family protein [Armatimonadota bacterium]MDR7573816.1 nitroreductase/quinone reductase family protein [Armatimonadota bacterium]
MSSRALRQALRRRKEISITVRGRRTGRRITLPVWFVLDDGTMWLLPVTGTRSQWFRNVQADPTIVVRAGDRRATVTGEPITGRAGVRPVVERFRKKYGRGDVSRYYTRFDAAVRVPL